MVWIRGLTWGLSLIFSSQLIWLALSVTHWGEVSVAGLRDSAAAMSIVASSCQNTGIYREGIRCPAQHMSFPSLMLSISPFLCLSWMPANLFPDFHMKEAVGVNAVASVEWKNSL